MPPPPKAYCRRIQAHHRSNASRIPAAITNTTPSAVIWNTVKDSTASTTDSAKRAPTT